MYSPLMDTSIAPEVHTEATVRDQLDQSMLMAFKRLKLEHRLLTDEATANLAGLTGTYVHWLTFRQHWSMKAVVRVAVALNCTVAEMLRLAGEPLPEGDQDFSEVAS